MFLLFLNFCLLCTTDRWANPLIMLSFNSIPVEISTVEHKIPHLTSILLIDPIFIHFDWKYIYSFIILLYLYRLVGPTSSLLIVVHLCYQYKIICIISLNPPCGECVKFNCIPFLKCGLIFVVVIYDAISIALVLLLLLLLLLIILLCCCYYWFYCYY